MTVLLARNVSVSAQVAGGTLPVLQNIDFALDKGRILGIVGESGAGKSMIGRTVAQMLPPGFAVTAGKLLFGDTDLVAMAPGERRALLGKDIAFIPQEPMSALNPVLTVGHQFDEHLKRLDVPAGERRRRAVEMLEAVHLAQPARVLGLYPHQMSGGMCQRVLIAMAFAGRPRLVIADEPTTALDVTIQARIVRLIAEMKSLYGTAVIFITHDLRLAAHLCDEILVLYAGRIVERGPARVLMREPAHAYTRCLRLASPAMSGARQALLLLPERMPGLSSWKDLSGCVFASRCPLAIDACRKVPPPLTLRGEAHDAACIRADEVNTIATPTVGLSEAAATSVPRLVVRSVGKEFRVARGPWRRETIQAVDDVSFTLDENEFLGVVGESGSGKSTLARLLVGLETPSTGEIRLNDAAQSAPTVGGRSVQLVFQDPQSALNPRRKIGTIVTQALEATGETSAKDRDLRARALMQSIGLAPDLAGRYSSQLSGGQRQRVNIARALCVRPTILVADEIVSGLDVSVQAQLLELLLGLKRQNAFAMVFISHDLSVVRYLCDRVLVMYRGRVVESGPTAEVFATPQHDYTRQLLAAVPPDDPDAAWAPAQRSQVSDAMS
jgi:peptide/nickel transport system ATP-binding protein